jgi:CheY-like chemotaxis protein
MGQTAEDIRDNIVKIADENGNCVGTGFFIRNKEYCVTCHHAIYLLDEIYVEREEYDNQTGQQIKPRYPAQWIEQFSDMQKDVAFLKVKGADFKPLEYRRETYGGIPVVVTGFPLQDLFHFPDGKEEKGTLTNIPRRFRWENLELIVADGGEDKKKKWKVKPEVNVDVYAFNGKFHVGFSGAPVCHEHDWKVVGMFEAKDDNQGYIIPVEVVIEKFELFFQQQLNNAVEKAAEKNIMKPLGINERSLISKRAQRTADVLQGAHILWVDDHPENNTIERNILDSFGISVDIARSTKEAVSMLTKKNDSGQRYEVIISDMGREGKHNEGKRFLIKIRKEYEMDVPVIFYIGDYHPKQGIPPYAFGMTNRPDDLLHYIMDALERQRG